MNYKASFSRLFLASVAAVALFATSASADTEAFDFDDLLSKDAQDEEALLGESSLPPDQARRLGEASEAFLAGDFFRAEATVRELSTLAPESPEVWHLLGLVLANLERFDESIAALDLAAELYQKNAGPLIVKGDILYALGRSADARAAYAAAVETDPTDWRATEALAQFLESEGEFSDASKNYFLAVIHGPKDRLFSRLRLANLLVRDDKTVEAIVLMGNFVRDNPGNIAGVTAIVRLLLIDGRPEEALTVVEGAIRIHPDDFGLALMRARALRDAGRVDDAVRAARVVTNRFPEQPSGFLELGSLLGFQTAYDEAVAAFSRGLELHPDDRSLLNGLGLALLKLDRIEESLVIAAKLTQRSDTTAADHFWIATLHEKLDHRPEAIAAYETAIKLDPTYWLAANNLAALLSETDPARAVTLAETAVAGSGGLAEVRHTLASALLAADRAADAVGILAVLASESPDDPRTAFRHGKALLANGQRDAARAELQRALDIGADFAEADEARSLLEGL